MTHPIREPPMSDFEAALKSHLAAFVDEVKAEAKREREILHAKVDAALQALRHIISTGFPTMDHAAVLDLAKAADKAVDDKVSAAVSNFQSYEATHTAMKDSLDDIGAIVQGIPDKLAKLDAITASAPAAAQAPTAPVTSVDTTAGVTTATTSDGAVTSLDHSTGAATTVDATGAAAPTDPVAAQAAVAAATDAGVTVPGA